jgi:hypothetical protein
VVILLGLVIQLLERVVNLKISNKPAYGADLGAAGIRLVSQSLIPLLSQSASPR